MKFFSRLKNGILLLTVMLLAACGGNGDDARQRERQFNTHLNQQLTDLRSQIAQLDKQLADLRADQDQRMNAAIATSKNINAQIDLINQDLVKGIATPPPATAQPAVAPVPAPAPENRAATPVTAHDAPSNMKVWATNLLIIIVIIVAIFVIFKIFHLNQDDEDELDEESDEDLDLAASDIRKPLEPVSPSQTDETIDLKNDARDELNPDGTPPTDEDKRL